MSKEPENTTQGAPLSETIDLGRIERAGLFKLDLKPSEDELEALRAFLGLRKLAKFSFRGTLEFTENRAVRLEAKLGASVTQSCVVTLEPVRARVDEVITRVYSKKWVAPAEDRQMHEDEDENLDRLVDPLDMGLVASEALALALPPYPRASDAALEDTSFAPPGVAPLSDEDVKPFAGLAALKAKMEEGSKE